MESKIRVVDTKNLEEVWKLIYSLVKIVTGDVDISMDGDLQSQIKKLADSTNKIRDDTTQREYKIGVENGLVYIQEVKE